MTALSSVTLATVAGVNIDGAQEALVRSLRGLRFARVMLLAPAPPTILDPRIEHVHIEPLTLRGYNLFMLQRMHKYVETAHVLTVQPDGYVLNPERWDPVWLSFDYVGAPWPEQLRTRKYTILLKNRVGNSGFVLRSRRLLQLTARADLSKLHFPILSDDLITCVAMYEDLLDFGIQFPDVHTAATFSIEHPQAAFGHTMADTFGFHGAHYLGELQAAGKSTSL
ncbi:DUF5672 family protein [Devosia sp.]|uniref:DUF5672 family protein n=1 Tax=Devosia sp. TaxID=1871048 RepID=UPI0035B2F6AA